MEERRADYPKITERLAVLETMQQKDLDTAEEWRNRFCAKLDKVVDACTNLPCKERIAFTEGFRIQLKFIWGIMSGLVLSLLVIITTNVTVMNELRKDIAYVKLHSYGVQEFENGKRNVT